MYSYLGLDLSLSSAGFFLLREDESRKYLTISTKPDQYLTLILRVKAIASIILNEIKDEDVRLVLLEDYFVGGGKGVCNGQTVIKLAVLGTIVRDELSRHGYRYITAQPSQIKKFETGKGNAQKQAMVKEVFKNHRFDTNSNDIADACAMAYLAKGYYEYVGGNTDFHKYQLEVLKSMGEVVAPYTKEQMA